MRKFAGKKKIVVYSHDTFGFGNIRRMLAISKSLVEADENVSLLLLSGSPMLHEFRIQPRMDYVKLPCLSRDVKGEYGAKSLTIDLEQIVRLRANIIKSTLRHFDPDILLVDKKPLGVGRELHLALEDLHQRGSAVRSVLLLRDILDAPEITGAVWRKNDYQGAIDKYHDRVLVVGSRDVFDVSKEYGFAPSIAEKVEFCGYIRREPGLRPRAEVRKSFGIVDEPMVLVTPGDGEDGYRLLSTYLAGLESFQDRAPFRSVIMCGPEMPPAQRLLIQERAAWRPDVFIEEFTDDIMSYMAASDLVVSMGGYNTVCEILTLKKRAIVVPRVKPVLEQQIRAERMSARGLLNTVYPKDLAPAKLIREVRSELNRVNVRPHSLYNLDMNALPRINNILDKLMFEKPRYTRTVQA